MSQSYDTIFENVLSDVIEKVKNTTIITTGFRHLDKLIYGLYSEELIVVGGCPAMRKTSFIQSMIREQANMGIPGALFVANESMNIRYVSRFYMILAQQKVERPFEENMKDIRDEFVKGMPIHIVQKYGMSIDYFRQKSIPLFMEQSVKCLYVEDIHSIQEYRFEKDKTKAARIVCKGLKHITNYPERKRCI